MLCGNGINLYFCSVKQSVRYEAAATSSVFCATILIVNSKRKQECGNSNVRKVLALIDLTAPIALSLCLKLLVL